MKIPKIYVYARHRSERMWCDPISDRLRAKGWLVEKPEEASSVIVPGDRMEATRFALSAFERSKTIFHLGGGEECPGDQYHHDGTERNIITYLSHQSKGAVLLVSRNARKVTPAVFVGPTCVDSIPPDDGRPWPTSYSLLVYNPLPWQEEEIEIPKGTVYAVQPAHDPGWEKILEKYRAWGVRILGPMTHALFCSYMRHAEQVIGNSSSLCYLAPALLTPEKIRLSGFRNRGRSFVTWNPENGSPSDNVISTLEEWYLAD